MPRNISDQIDPLSSSAKLLLQKQEWALSTLSEVAATLARADSTDRLVKEVCDAIANQGKYLLAWIGMAENDDLKTVTVMGGAGPAHEFMNNLGDSWSKESPEGLGPAGICIRTGESYILDDIEKEQGFLAWRDRAKQFGIRSAVACPVPDGDEHPFGVLVVYSDIPNAFGSSELQLFESLAKEVGFGVKSIERQHRLDIQIHEKEKTQERLAGALRSTIEAMSKTMEWRDPYTAGHQKRVALISMALAKKLGLESDAVQALYMAGMVHDIGKVAVPAEILTKPTHLTDLEMKMVQEHAETGYQILKDIPFPWPIADMVHQHHERLDGSGYPKGLSGDQISQGARILAVADTIEAMSTHRPYRPARGLASAMEEVRAEAGSKLDAKVVDAAFELLKEGNALQEIIESI